MNLLRFLTIKESIITGVKEIYYHKLRSLLTMIGITLGVMSLISMISIIDGARKQSLEIMNQFGGLNKVSLRYLSQDELQDLPDVFKTRGLTMDDMNLIIDKHSDIIQSVSPQLNLNRGYVNYKNISLSINQIIGATPAFYEVNNYDVEFGRRLTMLDDYSLNKVCVIGDIMKKELFGEEVDAVGKKILIEGLSFTVVGIFKNYDMAGVLPGTGGGGQGQGAVQKKTQSANTEKLNFKLPERAIKITTNKSKQMKGNWWKKYSMGNALWYKNVLVVIPYSTMRVSYKNSPTIDQIDILLKDSEHLNEYLEALQNTLIKARNGVMDFQFNSAAERYEMQKKQMDIFNIVLGIIAAISLLVGGIGIMNVILASIAERIREIGVRKSVGASGFDIFIQFLIETTILAVLGGILGVVLSFLTVTIIEKFSGLKAIVTPGSVILALSFSAIVGLVFGIYPSIKAAKLNPVEALRYE